MRRFAAAAHAVKAAKALTEVDKLTQRCIQALELPPEQRRPETLLPVLAFIKNMPEVKALSLTQQERLAQGMQLETYSAGDAVFHQGDEGDKFYIVIDGTFAVYILKAQTEPDNVNSVEAAIASEQENEKVQAPRSTPPPADGGADYDDIDSPLPDGAVTPRTTHDAFGANADDANGDMTWDNALRRADLKARRRRKASVNNAANKGRDRAQSIVNLEAASALVQQAGANAGRKPEGRLSVSNVDDYVLDPRVSTDDEGEPASADESNAAEAGGDHLAGLSDTRLGLSDPRTNRRFKKVNEIGNRGWFGELALLGAGKRSASVVCSSRSGVVASIDREQYQNILRGGMAKDLEKKVSYMCTITAFELTPRQEIVSMSFFFKPKEFDRGRVLYREYEEGETPMVETEDLVANSIFIIQSGECRLQVERKHVQARVRELEATGKIDSDDAVRAPKEESSRYTKPWLGDGEVSERTDGTIKWRSGSMIAHRRNAERVSEEERALKAAAVLGGQALNRGRLPNIFPLAMLVQGATIGDTAAELSVRERKEVAIAGLAARKEKSKPIPVPHVVECSTKVKVLLVSREELAQLPASALSGLANAMEWRRQLIDQCLNVLARRVGEAPKFRPTPLSHPAPPLHSPRPGAHGFRNSRSVVDGSAKTLLPLIKEGYSNTNDGLSGGGSNGIIAQSLKKMASPVSTPRGSVRLPTLPSPLKNGEADLGMSGSMTDRSHYRIAIQRRLAASGVAMQLPHFRENQNLAKLGKLIISQDSPTQLGDEEGGSDEQAPRDGRASVQAKKSRQSTLVPRHDTNSPTVSPRPPRNAETMSIDLLRKQRLKLALKLKHPEPRNRDLDRLRQ